MTYVLAAILFALMIFVGGKRGVKTFFALYMNIFMLILTVFLIACGLPTVFTTFAGCVIIAVITLFFVNGKNEKTTTAFLAVLTVLVVMTAVILLVGGGSHIQGFADENTDEICWYEAEIGLDMSGVATAMVVMGLIGAIVDTAVAVTSALNEVHENNPQLDFKELFKSGMNVGRDILGTTTNTLLFAFIGGFMTLIIWFKAYDYTFAQIINSKVFCQEFLQIMCSGIGCVMIIPTASLFMSIAIVKKKEKESKKKLQ